MRPLTRDDGDSSSRYVKTTDGVVIEVEPMFLESESYPDFDHYVWAYRVRIGNERREPVRLRSRYWRITDSCGVVREVRGEGVVGEQPLIEPGDVYEYTSGAPLPTPSGLMGGSYQMETSNGERLDVEIPTFSLDSPHEKRTLN